jgi:hypothetical protein
VCFKLQKAPLSSTLVEETDDVLHKTKHASTVCVLSAAMIHAAAVTFLAWKWNPSLPTFKLGALPVVSFEIVRPGGSGGCFIEIGHWNGLCVQRSFFTH